VNASIDNRSFCFEIMTAMEEMELGALLELFIPMRVGRQVTKKMRLGSLDLLVVSFGCTPIRQVRRIRAKSFGTGRISSFDIVRYLPRVMPNRHES
jgi:hypothetical protein